MTCAFSGLSAGCAGTAVGVVAVRVGHDRSSAEHALGFLDDLGDAERLAPDAVVADRVDQVARPDQHEQLAEVDLRDEHPSVAPEDMLGVGRERD